MITSLASLLLLVMPGYSLLQIRWVRQKTGFGKADRVLFGFTVWIFYLMATVLTAKILIPQYIVYVHWFNYFLATILLLHWFFHTFNVIRPWLGRSNLKLRVNLIRSTLGGTLPFVVPMIGFIVLITLYTPLIFQYDALAMYLIEGRELASSSTSLDRSWPTFGDNMPVMPIIYSWFYHLTSTPTLRLVPVLLFFLSVLLLYKMARRLSPRNLHVAYISVVSLVSMIGLHWYMAKTSLYLDLGFMFFAASSVYALIFVKREDATLFQYAVLGMNLAILVLSKEYGIIQAWLMICVLLFCRHRKIGTFRALIQSLFLLAPFLIRHFSYLVTYSFHDIHIIGSLTYYLSFLLLASFLLQTFIFSNVEFEGSSTNLSTLSIIVTALFFPALFFIRNFFTLGVPFGALSELYVQQLSELGINFAYWKPTEFSVSQLPDLFFSNAFMAMNLVPVLVFLLAMFLPQLRKSRNWSSRLLSSWFFYSLFVFYFVSLGQFEGGLVRSLLPLAIPVALMAGMGVPYLLRCLGLRNLAGTMVYTCSASVSLGYLLHVKLDGSEWWLTNLQQVIASYAKASYLEVLFYAIPWILLIICVVVGKKLSQAFFHGSLRTHVCAPRRFLAAVGIMLLLVPTVTAAGLFSQALRYVQTLNPSYFDEADSVRSYTSHWFIPVIEFYRSQLSEENSTTIGFGVTPLQQFLPRSFIDLTYPRNWLIHLPLVSPASEDEVLSYLHSVDASLFLIPTQDYPTRPKYEAVLRSSTLFKMISTSAVITGSDGQAFRFERLAQLRSFELHGIKRIPPEHT